MSALQWNNFARGLLTVIELGGYIVTVLWMQIQLGGAQAKVVVLIFAISVTISFSNQSYTTLLPGVGGGAL